MAEQEENGTEEQVVEQLTADDALEELDVANQSSSERLAGHYLAPAANDRNDDGTLAQRTLVKPVYATDANRYLVDKSVRYKPRQGQLHSLHTRHLRAIELHIAGHSNSEIAALLGVTLDSVSSWFSSALVKAHLAQLNMRIEGESIEAARQIQQLSLEALNVVRDISRGQIQVPNATDANGNPLMQVAPIGTRLKAAETILDRPPDTAKVNRNVSNGMTDADSDAVINRLHARIAERRAEVERMNAPNFSQPAIANS